CRSSSMTLPELTAGRCRERCRPAKRGFTDACALERVDLGPRELSGIGLLMRHDVREEFLGHLEPVQVELRDERDKTFSTLPCSPGVLWLAKVRENGEGHRRSFRFVISIVRESHHAR